jgi:hypothetical protein
MIKSESEDCKPIRIYSRQKKRDTVPGAVIRFWSDKIKIMQKEIRKAMIEAAGDDEKISELQEQYRAMTMLRKKISELQEQYRAMTMLRKKISAGLGAG